MAPNPDKIIGNVYNHNDHVIARVKGKSNGISRLNALIYATSFRHYYAFLSVRQHSCIHQ